MKNFFVFALDGTLMGDVPDVDLQCFNEMHLRQCIRPDAAALFDFLQKHEDWTVVLAEGEKRIQEEKIIALEHAGIRFAMANLVAKKSADDFAKFKVYFPDYRFFSVGSSYERDIVPAIVRGFCGIWITSDPAKAAGMPDSDACLMLNSLQEIQDRYAEL